MRIILLGAPGSGKGTQSEYFAERFSIPHISSGALFRKQIQDDTEIGHQVKETLESGGLVPDRIVIEMVMERILQRDCQRGYILDGFPRTYEQATALKHSLLEFGEKIDHAIYLRVPDEQIKQRMETRLVCPKCETSYNTKTDPPIIPGICDKCGTLRKEREDDDLETVEKRLQTFHETTEPIRDYYKRKGLLREINGDQAPDDVYRDIVKALIHHGNN